MFKALVRVAIAFAVVWMLVPHGAAIEFARPGFATVAHHFGWLHSPADFGSPAAVDQSPSASVPTVARDCAAAVTPKRHGGQTSQHSVSAADGSAAAPACPDRGERRLRAPSGKVKSAIPSESATN